MAPKGRALGQDLGSQGGPSAAPDVDTRPGRPGPRPPRSPHRRAAHPMAENKLLLRKSNCVRHHGSDEVNARHRGDREGDGSLTARSRSPRTSACAWSSGAAGAGSCWAAGAAGAGRQKARGAPVTDGDGKARPAGAWPGAGQGGSGPAPLVGLPSPRGVGLAGRPRSGLGCWRL